MFESVFFENLLKSFLLLFIIVNPFVAFTAFISMTKGMSVTEKLKQAYTAVIVAFIMAGTFLFAGSFILKVLGITMDSFIVAGGFILLILGLQEVLGIKTSDDKKSKDMIAIIIGTPLLCGPGTMTTMILLSETQGFFPPLIAVALVLIIALILLIFSEKISDLLGTTAIEVISRIMGFLLVAMAAEFLKDGVSGMIRDFKTN